MTQKTAEKGRRNGENPIAFRKYIPIVSAVVALGVAAAPFASDAQPQRRQRPDQCTASVQTGAMPGAMTKGRASTLIHTPLFLDNRYLSIEMPQRYVTKVRQEVGRQPEGERRAFERGIYRRNFERALLAMGTQERFTYECAPLSEPAASSERPPQPPPTATASTSADAMLRMAPDIGGDAGAAQQPLPAQSAQPDAGRPRTIQP